MTNSTRLLVAGVVLVVGLVVAFAIPPGTCSDGELVRDVADPARFSCRILYDVHTGARSLLLLKYGVAVVAVGAAAFLAVPVLLRRGRALNDVT